MDLALNNLERLICHKTKQIKPNLNVQIEYCLSFSLQNVIWLISVTRPMCAKGAGVFKFVVQLSHSLILVTESSNMAPHDKELSEDLKRRIVVLHEDGQGHKKIANTLKLSCSTVVKIIRCFKRAGSTWNRPRVGRPKKLSTRAEHHIQMLSSKDRCRSPVSTVAEIEEVGGQPVSATLYMKLVCMAVTPRGSLFWRWYTRKPANSLLKTCQQNIWITGTISYGQIIWKLICLVPMASSMCGGNQVRSTKISVSCLQSSMVVGMSWSGAAWVLQVLESYVSLRETWTPTCTVKYCSRAWSPPSRNWVAGQCSSMTMTPNTPPRRLLLYWRGWGDGLAKHL